MGDQTTVTKTTARRASTADRRSSEPDEGIGEFLNDVVTLTELQVRLALVDLKENVRRATLPLCLLFASATMLIASVPLALVGAALLISSRYEIQLGLAMVAVTATAVAVALPLVMLGSRRLRQGYDGFARSHVELRRNLAWLRMVLVARGRARPRPQR